MNASWIFAAWTLTALSIAALGSASSAQTIQTDTGTATFDVASVRALTSGEPRGSDAVRVLPGGRLTAPAVTLRNLIVAAYGIQDIQLVDEKRLLTNDRFAVEARTRSNVTAADARAMLRSLLAERFTLVAHRETRDLPVYMMTTVRQDGRLGDDLRRSGSECAPVRGPQGVPAPPPPPPPPPGEPVARDAITLGPEPLRCLALLFNMAGGAHSHWSIREMTIGRFAERLTASLGRPVIDRTGLAGAFDLDLTYSADAPASADGLANAPSLFTALQEQLGLKLESSRAPVAVLVIDRVEPPTEN